MHEFLDSLIGSISVFIGGNLLLSSLVALAAGVLSSLSPCLMTTVPLIVGYISADREHNKNKRAVLYSLVFCAGVVLVFTGFGVISALVGRAFSGAGAWWNLVLSVLLVFVALDMFDLVHLFHHHCGEEGGACGHPHHRRARGPRGTGYLGAFLLGLLGGVFSSPCATPALVAILALVSADQNMLAGVVLLFFYAVGHCALVMAAGCSAGFINRVSTSPGSARAGKIARAVFGALALLLAAYLVYTALVPAEHLHEHLF